MQILAFVFLLLMLAGCGRDVTPQAPSTLPDNDELDRRTYPPLPELYVPGDTTAGT